MRTLKHIINSFVWTIVGLFVLIVVLLQIPTIQSYIGEKTSELLEQKFGTKVSVGRVSLGLINRIIIDDVVMYDQANKEMLRSSRLSAKIELLPLSKGIIDITSAQVFGMHGTFYKKDANSPANYQFALDSLASKDTTSHTPLNLHIASLIIRNGKISYDRNDLPNTNGVFNTNHLAITDFSAHVIAPHITEDSLDVTLKRLSLKEKSGLDLKDLKFRITGDKDGAILKNFSLKLPKTTLSIDSIMTTYRFENGKLAPATIQYSGNIANTSITPSDLACFEPSLSSANTPFLISSDFTGTSTSVKVQELRIVNTEGDFDLVSNGSVNNIGGTPHWFARVNDLSISAKTFEFIEKLGKEKKVDLPEVLTRLGNVNFRGDMGGMGKDISMKGILKTDAGNATLGIGLNNQNISGHIQTTGLDLKRILNDDKYGLIATNIDVDGKMSNNNKLSSIKVAGIISQFDYNGYHYNNLTLDGSYSNDTFEGLLSLRDPNGDVELSGVINTSKSNTSANIIGSVRHFRPMTLHLTNEFDDAKIDFDINAHLTGSSLNTLKGSFDLANLVFEKPVKKTDDENEETEPETDIYRLDNLHLEAGNDEGIHTITLDSDFGRLEIAGEYDYNTLPQSIINYVGSKLPTLPGLPATTKSTDNNFTIDATITKTDWLNKVLNIPVYLSSPAEIKGSMNSKDNILNMTVRIPTCYYNEDRYDNALINIWTSTVGEMQMSTHIRKIMDDGGKLDLDLNASAVNNQLISSIHLDNKEKGGFRGTLNSSTEFFRSEEGQPTAHMHIHPSEIEMNNSSWHVQPSDIVYRKDYLMVDYFVMEHGNQHLILNGNVTKNAEDSLLVDLKGMDVGYILEMVDFDAVEFDGLATGQACIKSLFHNPRAYTNLEVKEFRFNQGRLGTLFADAKWNNEEGQIDINAYTEDSNHGHIDVYGYVSPKKDYIDLTINPDQANGEFIESFCKSFMDNTNLKVKGNLHLYGDLDEINLTGEVVADGSLDITSLNTHYFLNNDTIRLVPNEISFKNDTIRDRNGNIGILNGALHHENLTDLTFDLNIDANNLLCYDFKEYGEDTFFGTVFATGNCIIRGQDDRIDFDVNVTPQRGSFIEYNAASPDAISQQEFIEWRDVTDYSQYSNYLAVQKEEEGKPKDEVLETSSDLHINFIINTTPDVTLRLLMDKQSGDYIALNGSGSIRASYYDKGGFEMFGNYTVDHGVYKLTIQNIIKKDFQFQQGGTIVFSGDPYHSVLNLPAIYTVNGVSLSDLQLGDSFTSNNVRVDCMMDITGTASSPQVEFDLELPTLSADANQMIRSLINSEEEMNQQVIYLLSIGRFYNQAANNADQNAQSSQTSLAMQSLLSGTISQQINNVLSSFVNSNNWNFGANISTGDEGFNNAEYEGILSGRMLNNRLLINGQFGYRDNANATSSFIGDFDIRYLLFPSGNLAIKVYNQTNDRYFTRNSLNTQGIGLVMKKDFNYWDELFFRNRKRIKINNDIEKTDNNDKK